VNLLDRMISAVAPDMALNREMARIRLEQLRSIRASGYSHHGASRVKKSLAGWISTGGGADEDVVGNLDLLRERSRDLWMGTPIATGAVKTARTNIVGSGLRFKACLDAEALGMADDVADLWERTAEREFSLWADSKDCDAARQQDFYQLQSLAILSRMLSGDVAVLLPILPRVGQIYDLRVQLIEADRICDPRSKGPADIQGGVEVDEYGAPTAYYVAKYHPRGKKAGQNEWIRVDAYGRETGRRNVIIPMEPERPGQRRGVPMLAPVMEALKNLGRYSEAELLAATISGMFTVFVKSSSSPEALALGAMLDGQEQVAPQDDGSYELAPGAIVSLAQGEDVQVANPIRPNTAFDGFVSSVCRQIGVALEIPYELLTKHFQASYSASRAALLEAWKWFRAERDWWASDFCQPIYEEWLAEAVAKGRVQAPGFFDDPAIRAAYSGAEWTGPTPGQLDPLKEVLAAKQRVEEGFSTRTKETAELNGGDWEAYHRQRIKEERLRREGGVMVDAGSDGGENVSLDDPREGS